ncbi:hypothetical protein BDR05DRAFT_944701 [Suillus weaverae]|nr:hypothetical protein BDR05DRAFT_944701 [Suillus weaverae]
MCMDDRNNGVQLLSSLSGSTNINAMHHFNTIYGACATASLMKSACLVKLLHTICSMLFAANIDLLSSEFILTHTQLQLQGHTGYKGASSAAMDVQRFIQLFGGLILHNTPHLYCSKSFSPDAARIAAGLNDRAVGCMHAHVDLDLDGEFCPAVLGPWLRPELSQSQPSLAALAWPGIFASPSHLKPGQSRGFRAKPGRNITNHTLSFIASNLQSGVTYCIAIITVVDSDALMADLCWYFAIAAHCFACKLSSNTGCGLAIDAEVAAEDDGDESLFDETDNGLDASDVPLDTLTDYLALEGLQTYPGCKLDVANGSLASATQSKIYDIGEDDINGKADSIPKLQFRKISVTVMLNSFNSWWLVTRDEVTPVFEASKLRFSWSHPDHVEVKSKVGGLLIGNVSNL